MYIKLGQELEKSEDEIFRVLGEKETKSENDFWLRDVNRIEFKASNFKVFSYLNFFNPESAFTSQGGSIMSLEGEGRRQKDIPDGQLYIEGEVDMESLDSDIYHFMPQEFLDSNDGLSYSESDNYWIVDTYFDKVNIKIYESKQQEIEEDPGSPSFERIEHVTAGGNKTTLNLEFRVSQEHIKSIIAKIDTNPFLAIQARAYVDSYRHYYDDSYFGSAKSILINENAKIRLKSVTLQYSPRDENTAAKRQNKKLVQELNSMNKHLSQIENNLRKNQEALDTFIGGSPKLIFPVLLLIFIGTILNIFL